MYLVFSAARVTINTCSK